MKIKSLLLGSAAALVAVSGARAADAIIIPEPEVVEYVRVCDAAGTGFFYIPGTETCLKIGGYARFQMDHASYDNDFIALDLPTDAVNPPGPGNYVSPAEAAANAVLNGISADVLSNWGFKAGDAASATFASKLSLKISSYTDSEIGAIETFYEVVATSGGDVAMDSMYLSFAGLKMGYFGGFLDNGINGETDSNGLNNKFDSIQYTGTAGAVSFGVSLDEIASTVWNDSSDLTLGVTGMIGFSAGAVDATLVGFYDIDNEAGGVVGRLSADIGMGTLQARGTWAEDKFSNYTSDALSPDFPWVNTQYLNYVLEASYAAKIGDKLTLTPGFSYVRWYEGFEGGQDHMWTAGLTADYDITDTLAVKAHVEYWDFEDGNQTGGFVTNGTGWRNFLRLQASF